MILFYAIYIVETPLTKSNEEVLLVDRLVQWLGICNKFLTGNNYAGFRQHFLYIDLTCYDTVVIRLGM